MHKIDKITLDFDREQSLELAEIIRFATEQPGASPLLKAAAERLTLRLVDATAEAMGSPGFGEHLEKISEAFAAACEELAADGRGPRDVTHEELSAAVARHLGDDVPFEVKAFVASGGAEADFGEEEISGFDADELLDEINRGQNPSI